MAGPITWRNVDAPSNRDVMTGLALAGNSFGNAGDVFSKVIADRQAANQGAINEQNEMAKQVYLDLVATAKTPDAVTALEASGRLEQMRAGMTPANLAATRGATEARLTGNRQMIEAGQKFQTSQTEFENRTPFDQAMAAANAGNTAGVQAILAANPGMPNTAKIQEQLFKASTQATQTGIAKSKEAREVAEAPGVTALRAAQTAQLTAQTGQIPIEAADKRQARAQQAYNQVSNDLTADRERLSKLGPKLGGKEGIDGIIGNLSKTVEDKGRLADITGYLGEALSSNPEFAKLPASVVQNIALKHARKDGVWGMFGSNAKDLIADMNVALANPDTEVSANEAARSSLAASIKQREGVADSLMREANPALAARLDAAAAQSAAAKTASTAAATTAPTTEIPVDRPIETPGTAQRAQSKNLNELAAVETDAIKAGVIKTHSPEVKAHLENEKSSHQSKRADALEKLYGSLGRPPQNQEESIAVNQELYQREQVNLQKKLQKELNEARAKVDNSTKKAK